jgi:poly-gamma-glutamate synthesis protein (capsule biosynthesis protein)
VRLVAVGDILMHQDVQRSAREAEAGLPGLWQDVEPLLKGADIGFANLETPVAPRTGQPGLPFQFNGPEGLPAALRSSGFKVLTTANNHAYDQGAPGVRETLERLEAEQLVPVGSGIDRLAAEAPRIIEVRGLRVAFLAFTDLFNINLNRASGGPWVNPLDLPEAVRAVRLAKAGADAVVVSLHWGVEYSHQPTPRQREVAAQLVEAGADLILGHHPHVLQPVERLERAGHRALVAFSMGNFVSNQDRVYRTDELPAASGDSRDGVAVQCTLVKRRLADGSEPVTVEETACEPLWTLNNWREFQAGRARRREIRVTPVGTAITALQARIAQPGEAQAALQEDQASLRTLEQRRDRALEVLGISGHP